MGPLAFFAAVLGPPAATAGMMLAVRVDPACGAFVLVISGWSQDWNAHHGSGASVRVSFLSEYSVVHVSRQTFRWRAFWSPVRGGTGEVHWSLVPGMDR